MITLELDASPSAIFHLTAWLSFTSGNSVKFPHSIDDLEAGHEMLRRFEAYQRSSAESSQNPTPEASAADEIRKFKELLDIGAITEEEYQAKKKSLLGL